MKEEIRLTHRMRNNQRRISAGLVVRKLLPALLSLGKRLAGFLFQSSRLLLILAQPGIHLCSQIFLRLPFSARTPDGLTKLRMSYRDINAQPARLISRIEPV